MWIGCGHYRADRDSYLCFIEPHKPTIRRLFRNIETREHILKLQEAIDRLLSRNASIRDKRWWTFEDSINGKVDGQPLYLASLNVAGQSQNVLFAVTEHDACTPSMPTLVRNSGRLRSWD
jgi:hypothetical protein